MVQIKNLHRINLFLYAILMALAISSTSASVKYNDFWNYSRSTNYDGTAWGGYNLSTYANGLSTYSDCICWDWCDSGEPDSTVSIWENCYCLDMLKELSCESYSPIVSNVCGSEDCTTAFLESYHPINTDVSGSRWMCSVDIREFRDCDNSSGQKAIVDQSSWPYFVIYPKKSLCYGMDVDTLGKYDSSNWWSYDQERDCDNSYTRCDTNSVHTHHDNQEISTGTGAIPDPCNTKDGSTSNYACNIDANCYSGNCDGGSSAYAGHCDFDGSDSFYADLNIYNNTCGGSGYYVGYYVALVNTTCTAAMGSNNYTCDYDLANNGGESSLYSASNYCKKKEYVNCSVSSECWNDNGGYDCMGTIVKICTTGENGKNCYGNDNLQCDSGRCDTTCQAKLANNVSCDENSDCTTNICCGGTCASNCTPDIDVNPSSLTFNLRG